MTLLFERWMDLDAEWRAMGNRIGRRLYNAGIGVLVLNSGHVCGIGRYNRDWVLNIIENRMLP